MTGGAAEFFEELRREYLTEAPARLAELRKDLVAAKAGEPDAIASLKTRFHRLAGSGGSYGFPDISTIAREGERWVIANPTPAAADLGPVESAISRLAASFDQAAVAIGLPASTPPSAPFGWRALLIGAGGPVAETARATLEDARYTVDLKPLGFDPGGQPVSERPDLVVILGADGSGLDQVVASWALPGSARAGAVALVTAEALGEPFGQPFASLDTIIAGADLESGLGGYARRLGRIAGAPRAILLLDPKGGATDLVTALEGARARVESVSTAGELVFALERESWDGIVIRWQLPDASAIALVRAVRRMPAHSLTSVLILADRLAEESRLEAIRAGTDDVLSETDSPAALSHLVSARIDRARSTRAAAHRDDLTGLLNADALTDELERALGFSRRSGESGCLLVVDIDHFRRVNERFGHPNGDLALTRVATMLAASVRASDLTARVGGEEFGAVIRQCRVEDAVRLAEKFRRAVADLELVTGNDQIRVKVSVGISCYPAHGATAADLVRAAERALADAKSAGRDRVVVAGAPEGSGGRDPVDQ